MNNLLSYCGLVDAKIRASDKDLPVCITNEVFDKWWEIYSPATKNIFKVQIIMAHTLLHSTDRIVF